MVEEVANSSATLEASVESEATDEIKVELVLKDVAIVALSASAPSAPSAPAGPVAPVSPVSPFKEAKKSASVPVLPASSQIS